MQFQSSRAPYSSMSIIILSALGGVCETSVLPSLLGISEVELAECIKQTDRLEFVDKGGQTSVSLTQPTNLSPKVFRQALFSSSLFGENTVASALFAYYTNDFKVFLEQAEKAVKALIEKGRPLAIRRAYDALARSIVKMRVPLHDKDFCFLFIDKCMRIQREIIKFPSNSRNQLVLFCKIKGVAHYIGDRRSIGYINVCMGALNHNIRRNFKTALYHDNMRKGKDIILSLGDNDIKMMSSQFIVLYHLLEGQFSEGINFAYSVLFSEESDIDEYINTALYSYTTICAASMGHYALAQDILQSGIQRISRLSNKVDISTMKAFQAYIMIQQKRYPEALQIIEQSLNLRRGQIMTYSDLWCSRALCFYHYKCGNIQKSYDCFQDLLKANSYGGISHSNYLIAPFVLELLGAYYIQGYRSPQELTIQDELRYAVSSPSRPLRAAAHRIKGQIRAHDHGWDDEQVGESLHKSLSLFRTLASPPERAMTLIELARMHGARKNMELARAAAGEAWAICRQYGQPIWPSDIDGLVDTATGGSPPHDKACLDFSMQFLHNFRSQATFNPANRLVSTLLVSLVATFRCNFGCVFWADGTSIELVRSINIDGANDHTRSLTAWQNAMSKALRQKRSLVFGSPSFGYDDETGPNGHSRSGEIQYASVAIHVDAQDHGQYVFCLSGVALGGPGDISDRDSIEFLENLLSTQICVSKARNAAWRERIDNPVSSTDYASDDKSFIFKSRSMRDIIDRVDNVAKKDSTVIILGESGVGKELIARRLHERSRRKGEFVSVNLANIPYELFESECYGHEKGSFTGANRQKKGLFEIADSGTLFIDEIGDIPPALQVKLLRVLQERQFMRVGGTKTLHSNFRLITATNRDLRREIDQGKFREDLYYRLNVISIHIPPLRERPDDILFLADHFLRYYCERYQLPYKPINAAVHETIINYTWPGNVRELKNYMERYTVLPDKIILPYGNQPPATTDITSLNVFPTLSHLLEQKPTLNDFSDYYFEYIYQKTNGCVGSQDGIAAILGISRTTAYAWIKRLGLKQKYNLALKEPRD